MPYQFINQGRAGELAQPNCGTAGLGTCVGLAAPLGNGNWFIAHIDCESQVRSRTGACNTAVSDYVAQQVVTVPNDQGQVYITTGGVDFSTTAIVNGLLVQFPQAQQHGDTSFYIDAQGAYQPYNGHDGNNNAGTQAFSVPVLPACEVA